jgi:hypothetical protein
MKPESVIIFSTSKTAAYQDVGNSMASQEIPCLLLDT